MSHTLSGVTLARIESRRETTTRTDTDTLACLEDIHDNVRAITAVNAPGKRSIWTGAKDGGIVVRDYATLRPLFSIERKAHNIFVNCLCVAGEATVWAGLSDGSMRIFDAATYRLMDEFKAHGSAVTCMTVARMPSDSPDLEHHMQVVVTGSSDWAIAKWDAGSAQCLGRLQGHSNTVTCLEASENGELLISGGMDGCTCLWNLAGNYQITYENYSSVTNGGALDEFGQAADDYYDQYVRHNNNATTTTPTRGGNNTNKSIVSNNSTTRFGRGSSSILSPVRNGHAGGAAGLECAWPMSAHQGAPVVGIAINHRAGYFISIGKDGTAKACELSVRGTFLREVERRPAPYTSVFHDRLNSRWWLGGVDGIISIVDDRLPDLEQLATVHDHSGAYVSAIRGIGLHVAHEVWTLDEDGVLCKFTESNSQFHGFHPTLVQREDQNTADCEQAQQEIDDLRIQTIKNYNDLHSMRKELTSVEETAKNTNDRLCGMIAHGATKARFVHLALAWVNIQRAKSRKLKLAETMERRTTNSAQAAWYLRWLVAAKTLRMEDSKAVFADTMLRARESLSIQRSCVRMVDAALVERTRRQFLGALDQMRRAGSTQLLLTYYFKWLNFQSVYRHKKEQSLILRGLFRSQREALLHKYWRALLASRRRQVALESKMALFLGHFKQVSLTTLSQYYRNWKIYALHKVEERRKYYLLNTLAQSERGYEFKYGENRMLIEKYYRMWMSCAWDKANRRRDDEEELQCLELQAWYDAVEEKDLLTEDTLAHERDVAEREHEEQKQELAAVRATLQDESRKMYELKREIAMVGYSEQLQPGASIEQRMESVMLFFRSRGVYGVSDFLSVSAGKALFEKVMKPGAGPASGSTTPRAGTPTLSRPGAKKSSPGGPAGGAKKPAGPPPLVPGGKGAPTHPFEFALKVARRRVETSVRAIGYTPVVNTFDKEDWGVLDEWVQRLPKRSSGEIVDILKQLIVTYDACIATRKAVPEPALREFLLNSFIFMPLVTQESMKSAIEYKKEAFLAAAAAKKAKEDAAKALVEAQAAKRKSEIAARANKMGGGAMPTTPRRVGGPARKSAPSTPVRQTRSSRAGSPEPTASGKSAPKPTVGKKKVPVAKKAAAPSAAEGDAPAAPVGPPKPYLGIKVGATNGAGKYGVYVTAAVGPAEECGLKVGDEIVRFGGVVTSDVKKFTYAVSQSANQVGNNIDCVYERRGQTKECVLVVGAK